MIGKKNTKPKVKKKSKQKKEEIYYLDKWKFDKEFLIRITNPPVGFYRNTGLSGHGAV